MKRWLVMHAFAIACTLVIASCDTPPAHVPRPVAVATDAGAQDPSGVVDEATFCALGDALVDRLSAKADHFLAQSDPSGAEAETMLFLLTPQGARPELADVMREQHVTPEAVDKFIRANKDAADRCGDRLAARMNALAARVGPKLTELEGRGRVSWRKDVAAARIDALKQNKAFFLRFSAEWDAADHELDKTTFADKGVQDTLAQDWICSRVDMTDDQAAATKKMAEEYKVIGLPTIVLFDAKGREQKRITEFATAQALVDALAAVRPSSARPTTGSHTP